MSSSVKDVVDNILTSLRADTGTTLATATFRKGPIRAIRQSGTTPIVIVSTVGMPAGEVGAAAGNNWWHNWQLQFSLLVPDDPNDPEGSEDARYDLLDDFMAWIHSHRTLLDRAKVGRAVTVEFVIGTLFDDSQQVYRGVKVLLEYKQLQS